MKAKFSHVMNDDNTGITFLYFDGGSIQSLNDKDYDVDFQSEFCVHMDSNDHKKLEAALRKEPYDCVTFNEQEMKLIKDFYITELTTHGPPNRPTSMSQAEFEDFCEKLNE
jgi:hypothetical protein